MSQENLKCPQCESPHGYVDRNLWVCPECFHEWTASENHLKDDQNSEASLKFLDVNGTELQSGDSVVTVKDLKAGKETLKAGTKVKNIRLLENPVNGHDISCKIPGHGAMYLKCSVVKKVK